MSEPPHSFTKSESFEQSLEFPLTADSTIRFAAEPESEPEEHLYLSAKCNLIVNYLPQDIDDNKLSQLFQHCGELASVRVIRDRVSKKSLGYGFVKFTSEEAAKIAIGTINGFVIGKKSIKVSYARPASEDIKNCKVYVTHLPKSYSEQSIREFFAEVS